MLSYLYFWSAEFLVGTWKRKGLHQWDVVYVHIPLLCIGNTHLLYCLSFPFLWRLMASWSQNLMIARLEDWLFVLSELTILQCIADPLLWQALYIKYTLLILAWFQVLSSLLLLFPYLFSVFFTEIDHITCIVIPISCPSEMYQFCSLWASLALPCSIFTASLLPCSGHFILSCFIPSASTLFWSGAGCLPSYAWVFLGLHVFFYVILPISWYLRVYSTTYKDLFFLGGVCSGFSISTDNNVLFHATSRTQLSLSRGMVACWG